jgi:hypothetical protein
MAAFQRFGSPPLCVNDFSGSFLFRKREKLEVGKSETNYSSTQMKSATIERSFIGSSSTAEAIAMTAILSFG